MKGAGEWKFRCVATPVLCAHAMRHVGGLLFLIKTLFFLTCFLWFLLSRQRSYYDLHDTMKEGATSRRCIAISPLNKCLIQPPSATPKHTNTLLPENTPSKLYTLLRHTPHNRPTPLAPRFFLWLLPPFHLARRSCYLVHSPPFHCSGSRDLAWLYTSD